MQNVPPNHLIELALGFELVFVQVLQLLVLILEVLWVLLLGDALDPVYETSDVPYTLYAVRANGKSLGYVFGANQRGTYSNIQVIAVTEADLPDEKVAACTSASATDIKQALIEATEPLARIALARCLTPYDPHTARHALDRIASDPNVPPFLQQEASQAL